MVLSEHNTTAACDRGQASTKRHEKVKKAIFEKHKMLTLHTHYTDF